MTDEFTKQYAIRLPNGELYSQCRIGPAGHVCEPVVFDTRDQADGVLANLKAAASQIGIPGWAGWVEQRVCSPFSVTDPSEAFADEVTKWAAQQGGES